MTVRKNFLLDDEVAGHLEELAKEGGTTQTQVIRDMIEREYRDIEARKKLEVFRDWSRSLEKQNRNSVLSRIDSDEKKILQKVKEMRYAN